MFSSIRKLSLVFLILSIVMFVGCSQEPDTTAPGTQETATLIKTIPSGYYDTVDATNAATLRATLHAVIDDHTRIPYTATATDTWNVLELADEDPNDSGRILDVYLNASYPKYGEGNIDYNREHTWPNSYGFPNDLVSNYPYTDCHQLFLCNDSYNTSRSNKPYRHGRRHRHRKADRGERRRGRRHRRLSRLVQLVLDVTVLGDLDRTAAATSPGPCSTWTCATRAAPTG